MHFNPSQPYYNNTLKRVPGDFEHLPKKTFNTLRTHSSNPLLWFARLMSCCVYVDNLEDHRCISLVPWLPDVLDPYRNCLTFSVSGRGPLDRCTNTPPLQYPHTAGFAIIGAEFGLNLQVKNVTLGPLGQPVRNVTGGWLISDISSFRSAGVRTFLFVLLDGFTPHLALD